MPKSPYHHPWKDLRRPQIDYPEFLQHYLEQHNTEGAAGGGAALQNIQLKFSGENLPAGINIQNVVIRNISFSGNIGDLQALPDQVKGTSNNTGINYVGVSLRRISNAWIDHCDFYDISDDLLSVGMSSNYVTLSYNHFYFSNSWVNMNPDPVWNWVEKITMTSQMSA